LSEKGTVDTNLTQVGQQLTLKTQSNLGQALNYFIQELLRLLENQ